MSYVQLGNNIYRNKSTPVQFQDADRLFRDPIRVRGDLRDFLDNVDALGDSAECGKLAVERRLRRNAHEELRALAIGFAGDADCRNHAALVFHVAELIAQQTESPCSP